MNLSHIPIEDKAKVFDALCQEFQGKENIVGYKSFYSTTELMENEALVTIKQNPIYEWKLRADGNRDFVSAILKLKGE